MKTVTSIYLYVSEEYIKKINPHRPLKQFWLKIGIICEYSHIIG